LSPTRSSLDRAKEVAAANRVDPGANVREVRRMYAEIAELNGTEAWSVERQMARDGWRSDSTSPA